MLPRLGPVLLLSGILLPNYLIFNKIDLEINRFKRLVMGSFYSVPARNFLWVIVMKNVALMSVACNGTAGSYFEGGPSLKPDSLHRIDFGYQPRGDDEEKHDDGQGTDVEPEYGPKVKFDGGGWQVVVFFG